MYFKTYVLYTTMSEDEYFQNVNENKLLDAIWLDEIDDCSELDKKRANKYALDQNLEVIDCQWKLYNVYDYQFRLLRSAYRPPFKWSKEKRLEIFHDDPDLQNSESESVRGLRLYLSSADIDEFGDILFEDKNTRKNPNYDEARKLWSQLLRNQIRLEVSNTKGYYCLLTEF